ncbi:hypothetical protein K474DRAFT_1684801 [Panus rudis PR-1116 ss-1]|nr:hypothetical protein K474DRAFT_1684801 [Panus rudis PR-1116 ss-1]
MFRAARLPRRALLVAASAAAVAVHEPKDRLPIYPRPDPVILLQESPSELEIQIGAARRAVTRVYNDTYSRVQGVVSEWIGVEQAVEHRVKSLVAHDEPLTPGVLYVGVATLTGSILARSRFLLARVFLPPTLLVLSFNHFLPKTAHNISNYLGELEDTYLPGVAEKHEIAKAHSAMTWERIKEGTKEGRKSLETGLTGVIDKLQEATGLKLKESLGIGRETAYAAKIQTQTKAEETSAHIVEAAREKVESAKDVAEKVVEEVKAVKEEKTEVKRLV